MGVRGDAPGAALAALLSGVPLVLDWSGEDAPRTFGRALGAANAVLVPSAYVGTRVRECGVDATVIPESVDRGRIRGIDVPEGSTPEIVWSGRLDDDASLGSLLLALSELRDRGRRATVIGDGPRRGRYERQARDLRVDDRVEFVGALT